MCGRLGRVPRITSDIVTHHAIDLGRAMELQLWASLVGSAVLMLESGVRRRLPDDFRSRWRGRGSAQLAKFFSHVKPVLSDRPFKATLQTPPPRS